jgi:hypothetical protein
LVDPAVSSAGVMQAPSLWLGTDCRGFGAVRMCLQTRRFPRAIRPTSAELLSIHCPKCAPESDALANGPRERTRSLSGFLKRAADGTRTHDLLHGNQKLSFRETQESPANRLVSGWHSKVRCPGITGDTRGVSKPIANRLGRCEENARSPRSAVVRATGRGRPPLPAGRRGTMRRRRRFASRCRPADVVVVRPRAIRGLRGPWSSGKLEVGLDGSRCIVEMRTGSGETFASFRPLSKRSARKDTFEPEDRRSAGAPAGSGIRPSQSGLIRSG